ncbi:hypothetical protein BDV27DRAFT_123115 [Aspergillus caelatus]|uniref:Major facilitator superfamily (MFS) profile domain-containing protein n=1 Tax=Aspergillus caelatus TaxID=61420 RepID=A0A5N7AEY2_9EURO|nr:uncharacterized protein BDV27DRAFT_123115 [Aspergillus caelatus]KAE8367878.1 hypothetical protein BDV27DRAFT_123115 [Aspergillus caelatus]
MYGSFLDRVPGKTISGSTHRCLTWDFGFSFLSNSFVWFSLFLARSFWPVFL